MSDRPTIQAVMLLGPARLKVKAPQPAHAVALAESETLRSRTPSGRRRATALQTGEAMASR